MRRFYVIVFLLLAVSCGLLAQDAQSKSKSFSTYNVIGLGTLGGTFGYGFGVNNNREVSGFSTTADETMHAFSWRRGALTDLGTLGGPTATAIRINNHGAVVGHADTADIDPLGEDFCTHGNNYICRGFVWHDGMKVELPTLGGNNSWAWGINNNFAIGGSAETTVPDSTCQGWQQVYEAKPVIWERGQVRVLPTLPGDSSGAAVGISDSGLAIGFTGDCPTLYNPGFLRHAVLWDKGIAINLGSLGGAVYNVPMAGNNRGQVVGYSDLPGDMIEHPFLWRKGVMTDLGVLPGDFQGEAHGINDAGEIVGLSCAIDFSNCRAAIWRDGSIMDLNSLISANSNLHLMYANTVNDRGDIAGMAFNLLTGTTEAFLAYPTGHFVSGAEIAAVPRTRVVLPTSVREQLRRALPLSRMALSALRK